ncbi:MAG: hypothetical protein HRU13_12410 [Phycisphaerales bacterium]|nr:hypothetical protein [Phycisphaerales bacterium]
MPDPTYCGDAVYAHPQLDGSIRLIVDPDSPHARVVHLEPDVLGRVVAVADYHGASVSIGRREAARKILRSLLVETAEVAQ